jgi:DHA2 family multidrug resistance protein
VSLGLGCLQIVLDRGQEDDWFSSSAILTLSIICVLSIVCLIITQLTRDDPIVDLRLLKDRTFAVSSLLMFLLGFVLLGSTFLIPAYVQEMLGYTATDAGLVITPGGLGLLLLMPFIGRLVSRVDVRVMILVGLGLCSAALLLMTNFDLNTNYTYIMLLRMLQAAGLGFLFIPINTAAFSSLPKEKTNNASGLINLWRNLGGSIGISVASTTLARHQQYHHSVLAEHMRAANPAFTHMKQTLTQYMHHALGVPGTEHAYAVMGHMLDVQARMLSYLDAFYLFGLVFVLLIPTLLLMKMPKHVEVAAGH